MVNETKIGWIPFPNHIFIYPIQSGCVIVAAAENIEVRNTWQAAYNASNDNKTITIILNDGAYDEAEFYLKKALRINRFNHC